MLPKIPLFAGIAIPSYGLMLFISFLVGIILFDRRMKSRGMLPPALNYGRAWLATDVLINLVVIVAAVWLVVLAPSQWTFVRDRPVFFQWLFRLVVAGVAGYLVYGGIAHIRDCARARTIPGNEFTTYLAMWILFSAVVGSRLLYVMFHWSEFAHDIVGTFAFWRGGLQGLMFYGGLVGALVMGISFALVNRMPLLKLLDAAMPSIVLGEFFTRIGCYLNGCCFGRACNLPWAVQFPPNSPPAAAHLAETGIHPTQLYSSLAGLVMFLLAMVLERRLKKPGLLFSVMLLVYAGFRFGIDFVRYYEDGANFWVNQGISLGLALIAAVMVAVVARKRDTAQ